jgi:hypothetical protein
MICYPAGSSGRFLTTVVFKMANKVDQYVLTTKENSGHAEHENKIIPAFNQVENNNHPFVFRELVRDKTVKVIPVFSTHAYPKYNIIKSNTELTETKFITILIDNDDFPEIVANVLLKAEIPQMKTILNSGKDAMEYRYKTYYYGAAFILSEFKNRYGYEITLDNVMDTAVIKDMYAIELLKREKYNEETLKFMSPDLLPIGLDNRMLKIRYKDIFKKTENSYVALEQISDFLELPVPHKIFESYEKYVTDQTTMMTTYFPWLDVPRLHQNT